MLIDQDRSALPCLLVFFIASSLIVISCLLRAAETSRIVLNDVQEKRLTMKDKKRNWDKIKQHYIAQSK